MANLVEEEGIEPPTRCEAARVTLSADKVGSDLRYWPTGCRPAVLPLNDSPKLDATLARRAQSLNVE
jgi:hypothetical protein